MRLGVVVLNWNGGDDTLACLEALYRSTREIQELVVVDNGSTDGSPSKIETLFPKVSLIRCERNLGYSGGNNVGIDYLLNKGVVEGILLLNNDTVVYEGALDSFVQLAMSDDRIGVVGGYPLRFDSPIQLDHLGGIWNASTASFELIGLGARDGFKTDRELDYVCGCSILIKSAVFKSISAFEPRFFLFWEEAEFCLRAKRAGFIIAIAYKARLKHKVSASFVGGSVQKTYFWWRGRCLFIHLHNIHDKLGQSCVRIVLKELCHIFKLFLIKRTHLYFTGKNNKKRKKREEQVLRYKAAIRGFLDYRAHCFDKGPKWLVRSS